MSGDGLSGHAQRRKAFRCARYPSTVRHRETPPLGSWGLADTALHGFVHGLR
jgi:hypothetical protein